MKYKVGDRVRIKSIDWYNENKDAGGCVHCGNKVFDNYMSVFCGSIVTIGGVCPYGYDILEDMHCRIWTDEMIEGLVEEETYDFLKTNQHCASPEDCLDNIQFVVYKELKLPEGYIFKDEHGNVINATKIVLEKKKKDYPKTYGECCKVLKYSPKQGITMMGVTEEEEELFRRLIFLKRCRDAYWKIAGEEMGLGKPWEPDWKKQDKKYIISVFNDTVIYFENETHDSNTLLAFPTAEMRDAFYENFDPDIKKCKMFL